MTITAWKTIRLITRSCVLACAMASLTCTASLAQTFKTTHVFPQFADGRFSDGTYYTSELWTTNATPTERITCLVVPRGLSFSLSSFSISGTANERYTDGKGTFQRGYLVLSCTPYLVDAHVLYTFYSASGAKMGEATVFSATKATDVAFVADQTGGKHVGIAVANDSDATVTYTFVGYDLAGTQIFQSNPRTLSSRFSQAFFVDEVVTVPADFHGVVHVVAADGAKLAVTVLRYTSTVFTTIPVSVFVP